MEELQKLNLKLQAFKESFSNKIATITADYEDRIADLRVELTLMNAKLQETQQQLDNREIDVPEETTASPQE